MNISRSALLFFALLFSLSLAAQKSPFRKADRYYKAKSYAKAIPLYESTLIKHNNLSARTKLANCYRLTNDTEKAIDTYALVVEEKKAAPKSYYYYGEVLMQTGRYEEARGWFLKYAEQVPGDEKGLKMAEACEAVKSIPSVFPQARIHFFEHNSESDDNSPVYFQNGIVFSSDRESGLKMLKGKSDWTGRGNVHLFFSESIGDQLFAPAAAFSSRLNLAKKNTSNASFSGDGLTIFFARNSMIANRKDMYTMQLYTAQTSDDGKFKNVEPISFCSVNYNYMHPAVSPDGKQLFFVSDKPRGMGGMDLYVSNKVGKGWKKPETLGPNVNTEGHEGFPFLFHDGRLYFCSKGHGGFGGFDIFYTEQDSAGVWQKPVNLGLPINSSFDDISFFLTPDRQKGLFTSGRDGGDDDIFLFFLTNEDTPLLAQHAFPEAAPAATQASEPARATRQLDAFLTTGEELVNQLPQENPSKAALPAEKERIPVSESDQPEQASNTMIIEEALVRQASPAEMKEMKPLKIRLKVDGGKETPQSYLDHQDQRGNQDPIQSTPPSYKSLPYQGAQLTIFNTLASTDQTRRKIASGSSIFSSSYFEEVHHHNSEPSSVVGKVFRILGSELLSQDPIPAAMDALAETLFSNPDLDIEIRSRDGLSDKEKTAQSRILTVKNYLKQQGIAEHRISCKTLRTPSLAPCCTDLDCSHLEIRVLKL